MPHRLPTYRILGLGAFALGGVLILLLSYSCFSMVESQHASEGWVRHTYIVIDKANQTLSSLRAVMASSRGHLIVPTPRFEQVYSTSSQEVHQLLDDLRVLSTDNPGQSASVAALGTAAGQVLATVDQIRQLAHARGGKATVSDPRTMALIGQTRDLMDAYRTIHDRFVATEQHLLDTRVTLANAQVTTAKRWAIATGLGSILTLIAALIAVERQFHLRSQLGRQLEQRIAERTRDLTIANHDLESFSYSVAHDLKAPLRAIEGFATLAERRMGPSPQEDVRNYLTKIRAQSARSAKLVGDLLTFSQFGRSPLTCQPVDLGRIAAAAWDELDIEREQRGSSAVFAAQKNLPQVLGDDALLHQVLLNLLSNAIKYSATRERPPVQLGWRMEITPDLDQDIPLPRVHGEPSVTFFLSDRGIGFAMQDYPRLFTVFQRLHADHCDGSGIGLATCKRIIERHGGRIWANSAVGVGTDICFTLPLAPAPGATARGPSSRLPRVSGRNPVVADSDVITPRP